MNSKQLQQTLRQAKNERRGGAPHDGWVSQNRDILLMQVRNTTNRKSQPSTVQAARSFVSVFLPAQPILAGVRAFAVFVLMVGTVFGGGLASVFAYRDAAPGDLTYGVKLAVEQAQVALAPNEAYRVRLHATFADRRLEEAAKLAEGPADEQPLALGVLADFNEELGQLQDGLATLENEDPHGVAVSAKLLDRKMVAYAQVLRTIIRSLPAEYRPQALAVSDRVEGLSLQATAVLVEQHLAGNQDAAGHIVAHKIGDRIDQAEATLTVAAEKRPNGNGKRDEATEAIAAAKELLAEEDYQAAFSKMVEVVGLTKEVETEVVEEEAMEALAEKAAAEAAEAAETETEENTSNTNEDASVAPAETEAAEADLEETETN
jgi:hypothetical protein